MNNILILLIALRDIYQSAHWLCKGPLFYQDHLLFERLYDSAEKYIDATAEIIAGRSNDKKSLIPSEIYKKAYEKIKPFNPLMNDNIELYQQIKPLEEELKQACLSIDKNKESCLSERNLAGDISQESESRCYLIGQRIGKEDKE